MTPIQIGFYIVLVICFVVSIIFVTHNHAHYDSPIAKVTEANLVNTEEVTDINDNQDKRFMQDIMAELQNGQAKGQQIHLENEYSSSGAYDQEYEVGDELFVSIDENKEDNNLTGSITDVKRDKYIVFVAWIFIFVLLIVGKKQGLFSIISLAVNATLLTYALDVYVNTESMRLLWVCGISAVLFTVISLLIVNGFNEKTYTAIISTLLGTFLCLAITYFVLWITSENGLRYEEMEFLTRPYKAVFLAGLLLGSLGGVMDIAITIASSIFGLYESNHQISIRELKTSGMNIGKDIMGTITNILFFVYISGSIPMLILYFNNGSPVVFSLSMNLSLELARALAGGIGIVLTIPIGVYTAIFFVKRKKAKS
ncbi:YibE/F family protein [Virgibacillus sp. NKC19-3]|nr:YibE/F family protein [Virgibacillus sp. NKC19-3]MBY7144148.1 YibE/F family protein [Virgibacillus sp. NKC19-3]